MKNIFYIISLIFLFLITTICGCVLGVYIRIYRYFKPKSRFPFEDYFLVKRIKVINARKLENGERMIKKLYYNIYLKIFKDLGRILEKETKECDSILDVGCGWDSKIKRFSKNKFTMGVELHKPYIEESRKKGIHNKYIQMDILDLSKRFKPNSFDCVVCMSVIEHIEKEEGYGLIKAMETIARKKVIIMTPVGFFRQKKLLHNVETQKHRSGWEVDDMKEQGYKVKGLYGYKLLRSGHSEIAFKPKYLWMVISDLSQLIFKHIPKQAYEMICIWVKKNGR